MQLSLEVVRLLIESTEDFPVDLDDAWKWLEFKSKRTAKELLVDAFEEGLDFLRDLPKATGGRPSEVFILTVDCFKSLGMMAGTPKGKEIRKYFLDCERQVKEMRRSQPPQSPSQEQPEAPKSLPAPPDWKKEVWEQLPEEDKQHFLEPPDQVAARVARERQDIAKYLNKCWWVQ